MSVEQPERGAPEAGAPDESAARAALIDRLFREHNEALIRFLKARLRSYHDAREVAQEAYVRLLSLDEPGAVSYLRAFLFKTAANLAIDRKRREATHERVAELPLFHDLVDGRTPERRVADAETLQRLNRLIEALPPKCRQAFVLNELHGRDFASIAAEMKISERMVRKYVVRALLHFRTQLDLDTKEGHTGPGETIEADE